MEQDIGSIEPAQVMSSLQGVFMFVPQRSNVKGIYEILSYFLQINDGSNIGLNLYRNLFRFSLPFLSSSLNNSISLFN